MSMVIPTKRCFKNPSSKTGSNYYQRESSNPNHNYQVKHGNTSGTRNVKCTITSLTLSLQLVKNPGILERSLARLRGLLLELFNGSLVNTSALVDQVTSGGGLAGVDVAADNDRHVVLLGGSHGETGCAGWYWPHQGFEHIEGRQAASAKGGQRATPIGPSSQVAGAAGSDTGMLEAQPRGASAGADG